MKCSDVQDRLSAYYDGELSGTARDSVAQHLSACEQCTSEYAGFESLSRIVKESPLPTVPPEVWTGVEARFSDQYEITAEQLTWLIDHVTDLQSRVEQSCLAYLTNIKPKD